MVELVCLKIKWLVRYLITSLIKWVPGLVMIVNGHPNLVRICSYNNLAIIEVIATLTLGSQLSVKCKGP